MEDKKILKWTRQARFVDSKDLVVLEQVLAVVVGKDDMDARYVVRTQIRSKHDGVGCVATEVSWDKRRKINGTMVMTVLMCFQEQYKSLCNSKEKKSKAQSKQAKSVLPCSNFPGNSLM